jgi:hypothetical protein
MMENIKWKTGGIEINKQKLTNLRYADDIVLISHSAQSLEEMLTNLNTESKKVGLKINKTKTKLMFNKLAKSKAITIDNDQIEIVSSFTYLGQIFNINAELQEEINHRVQLAWYSFNKLKDVFKGELPICLKRKVFNECIIPVLTYGSETWTLTKQMERKIQTTVRRMERIILGITLKDKKQNSWIRTQTKITDPIEYVKSSKWKWAGHLARRTDHRWTTETTTWKPRGKRKRGRPRTRWTDEIAKVAGKEWMKKAQDRDKWRNLGEAFVQQWTEKG